MRAAGERRNLGGLSEPLTTILGTTKPDATTRGKYLIRIDASISRSPARYRPCGHCRKKGRTAEECVDGCEACRQARARCEGGAPCTRCMSMHLNCVEGTTLPLAALHPRGEAGGQPQSACRSCHRGNKKVGRFHTGCGR